MSSLTAGKFGDSQIKSYMKLGPQTYLGAESQSEWTIQLIPKPLKNSDNYFTAQKRNMRRSARGKTWCSE
jgi:hypothetical protein